MKEISIVFPHQLFEVNPCLDKKHPVLLVEEALYFRQFSFHKQKLLLHMASMNYYRDFLQGKGYSVQYIDSKDERSDIRNLIPELKKSGVTRIHLTELVDDWLDKRVRRLAKDAEMSVTVYPTPMFMNRLEDLAAYFRTKKRMFQTDFYVDQRKKRGVLIDAGHKPIGGKWSFDAENRKRYPAGKTPPAIKKGWESKYHDRARRDVDLTFSQNIGDTAGPLICPVTHDDAKRWIDTFLQDRFHEFGPYEDAIVRDAHFLNHSVLTPMLNVGLITPDEVIERALAYGNDHGVPVNSIEGFIRQVMGWREFIRAVYELKGVEQRTRNFWGFSRKIPDSFWTGETGVLPVDNVICKVLKTGYAHHIERLMVLGNFMLLCEFDPDEVYRWFMEMFIDAYDWVMVPNVYGMSQFADGGIMSTKPYISGSNYLLKMSDYPRGEWQQTWDALFWRFMHVHRDFFSGNPRMNMLLKTFDRMDSGKQQHLLSGADHFLDELDR